VLLGHKNFRSRNAEVRPVTLNEWGHGTTQQTSTVENKSASRTLYSFKYLSHASIQVYGQEVHGQAGCRHCTHAGMFWPPKSWANAAAPFCNDLMSVAATAWLWADSLYIYISEDPRKTRAKFSTHAEVGKPGAQVLMGENC
jgi:hypothetical protein